VDEALLVLLVRSGVKQNTVIVSSRVGFDVRGGRLGQTKKHNIRFGLCILRSRQPHES
jgi:hypothetical protein